MRGPSNTVGPISPGLVEDTGAVLFRDLWLRPDLAPRDRSIVTVAALITSGQFAQSGFHPRSSDGPTNTEIVMLPHT